MQADPQDARAKAEAENGPVEAENKTAEAETKVETDEAAPPAVKAEAELAVFHEAEAAA